MRAFVFGVGAGAIGIQSVSGGAIYSDDIPERVLTGYREGKRQDLTQTTMLG